MTIATGQQATAADVIAAIAAARKVATGLYYGNNTTGRQITVGFLCKLVIISCADFGQLIAVPGSTFGHATGAHHTDDISTAYLHASDGFVVGTDSTPNSNAAGSTYYYFAISG